MDKQILEILLDMQKELKDVKNELKDVNKKIETLEYKMSDGFETLEIKIDEVDLKLRKSNKKLSDQIALNMESIESLKQ